ncbi:hypothetical protein BaOVIS_010010 [Babesia ovis]|uniref:RAP domain-containing protein n=1 Tax=Babesia ovis TaxID=5869 RepID=A0A9W5TBV5_BABOV|nr:hypothetical protein BaOVIS_010010 [Babesia ovis]
MFDYNVQSFMRLLRDGIFQDDDELRAVFTGFQRYLGHLQPVDIVDILELACNRDIRENDEGIDLVLLLLCEMNHRMLSKNSCMFSLQQTNRICRVLLKMKFNRSTSLIWDLDRSNIVDAGCNSGFIIGNRNTPTKRQMQPDSAHIIASIDNDQRLSSNLDDASNNYLNVTSSKSGIPADGVLDFLHSSQRVKVPICESVYHLNAEPMACSSCCSKYGQLLQLEGYDHLALLIVLLGRSIVKQINKIKHRHENAVIGYIQLSAHYNTTVNSHFLGTILAQHQAALLCSRSLRNIAIVLQVMKKSKLRTGFLRTRLLARLADKDVFVNLCNREGNVATLLVSFSHLVGGIISNNALTINPDITRLGVNILQYVVQNHERLFNATSETHMAAITGARGNLHMLLMYLRSKYKNLTQHFDSTQLDILDCITASCAAEYSMDFRTSDLHKQVASVLQAVGVETQNEVPIGPHMCDLVLKRKKVVVEIDGPYHFQTALNPR